MTINSRRKGADYERKVELWLTDQFGDRITRTNRSGFDGEDFDLDGLLSIEVKNCAKLELALWLAQADRDAGPDRLPVVLHKRRGSSSVADDYVTMMARDLAALLLLGRDDAYNEGWNAHVIEEARRRFDEAQPKPPGSNLQRHEGPSQLMNGDR